MTVKTEIVRFLIGVQGSACIETVSKHNIGGGSTARGRFHTFNACVHFMAMGAIAGGILSKFRVNAGAIHTVTGIAMGRIPVRPCHGSFCYEYNNSCCEDNHPPEVFFGSKNSHYPFPLFVHNDGVIFLVVLLTVSKI